MAPRKHYKSPLDVSPVRRDTEALLRAVLEQPPGRALELGCGTGYLSIELAKRGWEVTATAILQKELEISRENARSEGVSVKFVSSWLFSQVRGRSDAIIFNPPLIFSENRMYFYARGIVHRISSLNDFLVSLLLRFPNRKREALITRFLGETKQHLAPNGALYLLAFEGDIHNVKANAERFESSRVGKNAWILRIQRQALR